MTSPGAVAARWGVFVVAGIHLGIGLWLINRLSLWGDEAFSAQTVHLPLGALLSMVTHIDINMSAYYLMLKAWTSIFGHSEVALRLPSLLMTTATIFIAARLVTRWFGPLPGLICALAVGMSPYFLTIGLTARPFAMLGLLYVLTVACFVRALGQSSLAPWLVLVVVDVLALYTSLLAILFIAAQVGYLVLVDRRFYRIHVVAGVMLALGMIPTWLYLAPTNTLNWLTESDIPQVFANIIGDRSGLVFGVLVLAGLLFRPSASGDTLISHPRSDLLLPGFVVLQLAVMVALLPKQTLFIPPYLVTVLIAAAMLAGAVVVTFRPTLAWLTASTLIASLFLGFSLNLEAQPGLENQNWRSTTAFLDASVQPSDTVVFPNTFYRVAAEHYGHHGGYMDVGSPALPASPWFSQTPYEYDRLKRTGYYLDADRFADGLAGRERVWAVGPDDNFMALATSALTDAGWALVDSHNFTGLTTRLFIHEVTKFPEHLDMSAS
ncbi:MAG: glycosyltransferase family 39 protein [Acidimicrobiia bacterium]